MPGHRTRGLRAFIVAAGGVAAFAAMSTTPSFAAATVPGTVSSGKSGLTLRVAATTASPATVSLRNGTRVIISCYVAGQWVKGRVRTTNRWDRLANGRYASDAFIRRSRAVQPCPPPPPPPPVVLTPSSPNGTVGELVMLVPPVGALAIGTWVAPVPYRGTSGFRTPARPEHDGIDLAAPRNTPIRAVSTGTVITVVCNTSGPSCDIDGGTTIRGCGWYVEIRHAGDIITRYCHMVRRPDVTVGQVVPVGHVIGLVGTSGHSSGPHLHFEVHFGTPWASRINAIDPVVFMRSAGVVLVPGL